MAKTGAYLFQGNALVCREGEDELAEGLEGAAIGAAFPSAFFFETTDFDGKGRISVYSLDPALPLPSGWRSVPLRQALSLMAGPAGRLLRAYHILQWRGDSAFCGSCGAPNGDSPLELARLCPRCGRLEFPRISPAIIVLVLREDGRALLAHNRKFSGAVYSLVAGFTEAGESLEDTVVREVREEVGLEAADVRYVASQPWPFPNSLMVGFVARYAGGDIAPDGQEITDAQWFSRDALPELPGPGSVSRRIIELWRAGEFEGEFIHRPAGGRSHSRA